jgi:hypothetical protein
MREQASIAAWMASVSMVTPSPVAPKSRTETEFILHWSFFMQPG